MTYPIPDAALDDRLAIVGTAGAGKTYAAMTAVERLLDRGARVVVPDPLGVWFGLRLKPDGATLAYPVVVVGGPHGDLPITEHAGALIGETIARANESFIIDLSGFGTKAAERRFMLAMLTALYRQASGEPVHLVFDEADMWAPQKLMDKDGDAAKLLGQMETIVRRGRVKGFIPWLITQRPAVLSKDVLSQADGLVAMKLTASQDRAALGAWIEGQADVQAGKAILASMPSMQRGQGVVWIPARGLLDTVQFPVKKTFDSSRTPKRGEARRDVVLKPIDIEALRGRLATVETEIAANDPKKLKARIRELQAEFDKGFAPGATEAELTLRYEQGHKDGYDKGYYEGSQAEAQRLGQKVLDFAGQFALTTQGAPKPNLTPPPIVYRQPAHSPQIKRAEPQAKFNGTDGGYTGPQTKILRSLSMWKALGHLSPTRSMVALCAGYSPSGSAFTNPLGALRSIGAVDYPSAGTVRLVANVDAVPREDAGAALWAALTGPEQKIVEALQHPQELDRGALADASGYSAAGSAFTNPLGHLRSLGLLTYPQPGRVALESWVSEILTP